MDHMRNDGGVTFYQWQVRIADTDTWTRVDLPPTGNGHRAPLHPSEWHQTANGECWQRYGFTGFLDEAAARAAEPLVARYASFARTYGRDAHLLFNEYRLIKRCVTQATEVLPLVKPRRQHRLAIKSGRAVVEGCTCGWRASDQALDSDDVEAEVIAHIAAVSRGAR